jgi:hypothetical protein
MAKRIGGKVTGGRESDAIKSDALVAPKVPYYLIPGNHAFRQLTAGESWYCKNMMKGSTPPRGGVYKRGEKRFKGRTWQRTEGSKMEFLPATKNLII